MKKLFAFIAAGLLLVSCSNDDFSGVKGQEEVVNFSFAIPGTVNSRAAIGGTDSKEGGVINCQGTPATFSVQISYGDNIVYSASQKVNGLTATFQPKLVVGEKYDILAYAQMDGAVDFTETIAEEGGINDESQDAYYLSRKDVVAEPQMSGILKRHTAKLRLIANDYTLAETQLGKKIESVKVIYNKAQETIFDIKSESWSDGANDKAEFENAVAVYTAENNNEAKTLFVDYIPATTTGDIVNFNIEVTFEGGHKFTREIKMDVPIRRNWLTTLTGNFFTAEMELELDIEPAFENGDSQYNLDKLLLAFQLGGEYTLMGNAFLSEPLVLEAGKFLVLNLNGYTITNASDLWNDEKKDWSLISVRGGSLTINGDGKVIAKENDCFAADVQNGGSLTINGGEYVGNISAVYVFDGSATIKGGEFSVQQLSAQGNRELTLNCYDANNKAGTASIEVFGGRFFQFNPENNAAEGAGTNYLVTTGFESVYDGISVSNDGDWFVAAPNKVDIKSEGVALVNDEYYAISSPEGFVWVNKNVYMKGETNRNVYIELVNDIDMAGVTMNPELTGVQKFVFNGNNHIISNWDTNSQSLLGCGEYDDRSPYIVEMKNVTIKDCAVGGGTNLIGSGSFFVGYCRAGTTATIENCHIISCSWKRKEAATWFGGIAGYISENSTVIIKNCSMDGATLSGGRCVGGFVGLCQGTLIIENASVKNSSIKGGKLEQSGMVMGWADVSENINITTTELSNNTVFGVANSKSIYGGISNNGGVFTLNGEVQ